MKILPKMVRIAFMGCYKSTGKDRDGNWELYFLYLYIMDSNATRSFLIEWLKQLKDQNMLAELEAIAKSHSEEDWWNELPESVKEAIQRGNRDYLEGRVISNEEANRRFTEKFGL